VRTPGEPPQNLSRRFLARKLAEVLLDVLDLERALLEVVLLDVIFHGPETGIVR